MLILIKLNELINNIKFYFIIFLFLSCAAIQSPSGGEKDIIPPYITSTEPKNGETNFSDKKIIISFSEHLNANSIEKSIKITPILKPEPNIIYKRKKIIIYLKEPLLKNRTYIISIGKNLEDEHNVRIKETEQIAFSTGSFIDDGSISGKVYFSKEGSMSLWKLSSKNNLDNFYLSNPDYTYDISESGNYEFKYLSQGDYLVSLVNNEFSGRPISLKQTQYSLSSYSKINIGEKTIHENVDILMGIKNKYIKINELTWINGGWGKIKFTQALDSIFPLKFYNELGKILKNNTFIDPVDSKTVHFFIDDTLDSMTSIKFGGLFDSQGRFIDSAEVRTKVKTFIDTSNIEIISPKDNYILPIEDEKSIPLQMIFSSLVDSIYEDLFILYEDSIQVPFTMKLNSPLSMEITPSKSWKEKSNYKLKFNQNSISTKYGKGLSDSVNIINFRTSSYQKFGALNFFTKNTSNEKFIAKLSPIENNLKKYNISIDSDENYEINKIIEGEYFLIFFADKDGNKRYSNGDYSPFKPAEWFYFYPDTVKIRSNWEVDLGVIDLRIN